MVLINLFSLLRFDKSLVCRRLWLIVADVLTATLQFDPSLLRGYIFSRITDTERDGVGGSGILNSVVMIITTRDPEVWSFSFCFLFCFFLTDFWLFF